MSSNYFSCNVASLSHATDLGQGTFSDPAPKAKQDLGILLAQNHPYVNPFPQVVPKNYTNIVVVFPGNSQLSTSSSYIPYREPARLLEKDRQLVMLLPCCLLNIIFVQDSSGVAWDF